MSKVDYLPILLIFIVAFIGCDKSIDCPNPDDKDPQDTSKLMGKLDTLWSTKLLDTGESTGTQRSIDYHEGSIILTYSNSPIGMIASYNAENKGDRNWIYNKGNEGFISSYLIPVHQIVVNKTYSTRLSINMDSGEEVEYVKSSEFSGPRGIVLGDFIYYDESEDSDRTVHLRRSHVKNLGAVETLYTLDNIQIDNSKKSINSMNLWIHPETGDSILIFQHRMLDRVDVVAWNMDKREVVWRHDDITPNGNSNHQQIFIHEDKAYFGGSVSFFCFDMYDGRIVWRYDDTSGQTPFMSRQSCIAESISSIIVAAGGRLIAFDLNSGSIRWNVENLGDISSGSPIYHKGIIYRTMAGLLSAVRATNGSLLWSERSSRIPMGRTSFQGELAIDPERGILYATDDDELFAIKVYED